MTIQHKTFTKPGRVPRSNELVVGQLSINAADGKLFIELLDGTVICVGVDIDQLVSQQALSDGLLAFQEATNEALATKTAIGHHHPTSDIDALSVALDSLTLAIASKAAAAHRHQTSDIAGLATSLNDLAAAISGKANAADVATSLNGKANAADVTASLNGKANAADVATSLNAKANTGHTHQIADVGSLSDVLNGKANAADVTASLNSKADSNHTHPAYVVAWATPGAIGSTTPNTGAFTILNVTSNANAIGAGTGCAIFVGGISVARSVYFGNSLQVMGNLNHVGTQAGFFGATITGKPTVSGSRSSGVALTNLLTSLATLGLITNSSTA